MRDYVGISPSSVPSRDNDLARYLPTLRRDLGVIDYFLRDLSRGVARIQKGEVPDGSGDTIINQTVSDLYWYKPGFSPFRTAFMDTASGGSGIISSTAHATKGYVYLGSDDGVAFDETNTRLGIRKGVPTAKLHIDAGLPSQTPASDSTSFGNTWEKINAATFTAGISSNDSDTSYISRTDANGTFEFSVLMSGPAPASSFGTAFSLVMRRTGTLQAGSNFTLFYAGSDGIEYASSEVDINSFFTTSFAAYVFTTSSATGFSGLPAGRVRFSFNNPGSSLGPRLDITYAEITGTTDVLQKWESGATLDQLAYGSDGGSGTDLQLSGNAELFLSVGDGSTGLRFATLSNSAYIEVGTTAQAQMNLILGGNRASTGTLLTSNFTDHRFNGNVGIGTTPSHPLHVVGTARFEDNTAFTVNALTQNVDTDAWDAGSATVVRLTAAGGVDIGGITSGIDGRLLIVYPVTNAVTFNNDDSGASVGDRIRTHSVANETLQFGEFGFFIYDSTSSRWRFCKFLTSSAQTIVGGWVFLSTLEIRTTAGSELLIVGDSAGTSPYLRFYDNTTTFSQVIQGSADIADGSNYALPVMNGASDVFAMKDLIQTLANKEMAVSTTLVSSTASSGASFKDTTTSTKRLRMVLSGAVGNSSFTLANTAARDYTFGDVPGLATMAGNGADPPASGAVGKVDKTGQTANIASTNLTNATPAGIYLVTIDLSTQSSDPSAGTINCTIAWTDSIGATSYTSASISLASGSSRQRDVQELYLASGNITYSTAITGSFGTSSYRLRLRCVYLG